MKAGERRSKLLVIGPYPPPNNGWSLAIREEMAALEAAGVECALLNTAPNRNEATARGMGFRTVRDYAGCVWAFAGRGYDLRLHMNGDSLKGVGMVLVAQWLGWLRGRRSALSFYAGLDQQYFPARGNLLWKLIWAMVFHGSRVVFCECEEVAGLIREYRRKLVFVVPLFSKTRLDAQPVDFGEATEAFLLRHQPLFFSYFAYRPAYHLEDLVRVIEGLKAEFPQAGFILVDDHNYAAPAVRDAMDRWFVRVRFGSAILRTGGLDHDRFLALLGRSTAYLRTHHRDGVSASVLEAMALGVPVVAVENGIRPDAVSTYPQGDWSRMLELARHAADGATTLGRTGRAVEARDPAGEIVSILQRHLWRSLGT